MIKPLRPTKRRGWKKAPPPTGAAVRSKPSRRRSDRLGGESGRHGRRERDPTEALLRMDGAREGASGPRRLDAGSGSSRAGAGIWTAAPVQEGQGVKSRTS
jgi:hypothetical protein